MCYYERTDFICGDHKWGNMKMQCELQYRIGETCGMAPRAHEGYTRQSNEACTNCQKMEPKRRRRAKAEQDIQRWAMEDPMKWRNNIGKAREIIATLEREIIDLNNKRTSVRNRL